MMPLVITLAEQIPSGKNAIRHVVLNGRLHSYPDERFKLWRGRAAHDILEQQRTWSGELRKALPLRGLLLFSMSYREIKKVPANGTRDLTGMQDALQHLLEYCGVIASDGQIKSQHWAWPWRTTGPCAVITLDGLE